MIVNRSAIDNPWLRAAVAYFVATLMIAAIAYPALDGSHVATFSVPAAAAWILGGTALLCLTGRLLARRRRLVHYASVLGIFAYLPLLASLLTPPYLLYMLSAASAATGALLLLAFLAVTGLVVAHRVGQLRWSLAKSRFLEKEFIEGAGAVTVRRNPRTSLPARPGFLTSGMGKVLASLPSVFLFLLPSAYLAQRLASTSGGAQGTLALLTVLSIPLAVYLISELVRGWYLWIYLVRQIERKAGKPVLVPL